MSTTRANGSDGWPRLPLASLDFGTTCIDPRPDRVLCHALIGGTDTMLAGAPSSAEGPATVVDWVQS